MLISSWGVGQFCYRIYKENIMGLVLSSKISQIGRGHRIVSYTAPTIITALSYLLAKKLKVFDF